MREAKEWRRRWRCPTTLGNGTRDKIGIQ